MLKAKIVVFDLTGGAMDWIDEFVNEDHVEIFRIITMDEDSPMKITELPFLDNWDYIFVFEHNLRDQVNELLGRLKIQKDKIIFPLDLDGSLSNHVYEAMYMFKGYVYRYVKYLSFQLDGDEYAVADANLHGMFFLNRTSDDIILQSTFIDGSVWSQREMELFYELSAKHYLFRDEQDIFCDIGANIGTTCLFFKKLDPDISILAFEPSKENYKMLLVNAILNEISLSEQVFVPMGLSDKKSEGILNYDSKNPGGSTLRSTEDDMKEEKVMLTTFDDYVKENDINIKRIKYIWVDIEGYEGHFLKGARKTLAKINVPFFMEFRPGFYMYKDGEFELLMNELEMHFNSFISAQHPEDGILPLKMLWNEQNNTNLVLDLFLMK